MYVCSRVYTCALQKKTQTKATSQKLVPTITCTSSNVVQTILQGFAQVPGLNVFYGPDTYMGRNLRELFQSMVHWSDEQIKAIHPLHSRETLQGLLPRFHIFEDGTCIVHHIFGEKVYIYGIRWSPPLFFSTVTARELFERNHTDVRVCDDIIKSLFFNCNPGGEPRQEILRRCLFDSAL